MSLIYLNGIIIWSLEHACIFQNESDLHRTRHIKIRLSVSFFFINRTKVGLS